MLSNYSLGLGVWNNKDWAGTLFPKSSRSTGSLPEYSGVFNAVEGNNTFYGLPSPASVARWISQTDELFKFCFKFPRTISHHRRLRNVDRELEEFLQSLSPLGPRLGPFLLQLPGNFGPSELPVLDRFLSRLPSSHSYSVEVRDPRFFSSPGLALTRVLERHDIGRVILDNRGQARAMFELEPPFGLPRITDIPSSLLSGCGNYPFVRFVGHTEVLPNSPYLLEWSHILREWITEGHHPFIFIHTVDDRRAPFVARSFHDLLSLCCDVGDLPAFPGSAVNQLQLF